ncbi:hypothetical protein DWUX_159 [Desulfovibrio diazotrophicus]|nr:hypothetical protein DWUX_159 [Desulfovibrio diazotrophicus]
MQAAPAYFYKNFSASSNQAQLRQLNTSVRSVGKAVNG